ncbi:hypothetical protein FB45DRAFT_736683, partial [Roridomyces roridus]
MGSSAVESALKRVQDIHVSISEHRQAIEDLEKQKYAAYGELNALRDPITRLPVELSSMIFKECIREPPVFESLRDHAAPMLLLRVCRSWTRLALSTPSLW